MHEFTVTTSKKRQVVDITELVTDFVGKGTGLAHMFVTHTTAAITTADLDPGTDLDLLDALAGMLPNRQWRHPHDPEHAPDHLLASILGPDVLVPYRDGELLLGTWQHVILIEFDGPRERRILVSPLTAN